MCPCLALNYENPLFWILVNGSMLLPRAVPQPTQLLVKEIKWSFLGLGNKKNQTHIWAWDICLKTTKSTEHHIPLLSSHIQTVITHISERWHKHCDKNMFVSAADVVCWLWKSTLELDWYDINGAIVAKRAYSIKHGYNKHGSIKPWKDCWAFLKKISKGHGK